MQIIARTALIAATLALAACGPHTTRVTVAGERAVTSQVSTAVEATVALDLWSGLDADARDYTDVKLRALKVTIAETGEGNAAGRIQGKVLAQTSSATPIEIGAFDLEVKKGHSQSITVGLPGAEAARRSILERSGNFGFVLRGTADKAPANFEVKLEAEVDAIYGAE